jgi:hypothetical protein
MSTNLIGHSDIIYKTVAGPDEGKNNFTRRLGTPPEPHRVSQDELESSATSGL